MIVNNNIEARTSLGALSRTQSGLSKSIERLSTGLRINSASDDAAGLAVSEKMRSQIKGYSVAKRNAQDAISLIQTAEGALGETHNILQRLRELAVQAASDTLTDADRAKLQNEADELLDELDKIANDTQFNTKKLFDGSIQDKTQGAAFNIDETVVIEGVATDDILVGGVYEVRVYGSGALPPEEQRIELVDKATGVLLKTFAYDPNEADPTVIDFNRMRFTIANGINANQTVDVTVTAGVMTAGNDDSLVFQVGSNAGQTLKTSIAKMDAASLGLRNMEFAGSSGPSAFSIRSQNEATQWLNWVDYAISEVSEQRAILGAKQNRLESTINSLQIAEQNIQAAESRIRDADMAQEMMEFTRLQILQQTGTAMLASANMAPQSVLALF